MFTARRYLDFCLSLTLVMVVSCSGDLGCGCSSRPLPNGQMPVDQTLEGGAQIRVSAQGFDKVTSIVPGLVDDTLGQGLCLPEGSRSVRVIGLSLASLRWCQDDQGSCDGCAVNFSDIETEVARASDDTLRISMSTDLELEVPLRLSALFLNRSCTLRVTGNNLSLDADVGFNVDGGTGELRIGLDRIGDLDISGINFDVPGCGLLDIIADVFDVLADIISSPIGGLVVDLLEPVISNLVEGLLPDPLGLEGVFDTGGLIGSGTREADLEMKIVPGGYVALEDGGLSLGMITAFNSDRDTDTRERTMDSEPARCVPAYSPVDFAAAAVPVVARSGLCSDGLPCETFSLAKDAEFAGSPDRPGDIAFGLSETTLDLLGHHIITSGALCTQLGPESLPGLTLGTLSLLVPSLGELASGDGRNPLLLDIRPLKPLGFTVGDGTDESPLITAHLDSFALDFYVYAEGRYTRGFTVIMTADIGLNLDFSVDELGNPAILPVLVGLEASQIGIEVENADFIRESEEELEAVLPDLLELVLPALSNGLGAIALPEFAGFRLDNLEAFRVQGDYTSFLAIGGELVPSGQLMALGQAYPSVQAQLDTMLRPLEAGFAASPSAALISVHTPAPADIRAARTSGNGNLPSIRFSVDEFAQDGSALEWTYRVDNGPFHAFRAGGELVVDGHEVRSLALQGRHRVSLQARRVDGKLLSLPQSFDVVIDSAPPTIVADQASIEAGRLVVPAYDLVSEDHELRYAYGHPAAARPETAWQDQAITKAEATSFASDGVVRVWVADGLGNTDYADIELDRASTTAGGCNAGAGTSTILALALAFVLVAVGRRRRGLIAGLMSVALLVGACSSDAANTCEVSADCECPDGEVGVCTADGTCICSTDVLSGRLGQYADMAVDSQGAAWISTYNRTHGDLMVARVVEDGRVPDQAWTFADGVPEGPVVLEQSMVRGGIFAAGPNVGLYSSIAVSTNDDVFVSHFDSDSGSLRLSSAQGGPRWAHHTVRAPSDVELGGGDAVIGQYSSLTVRDDGQRPGIVYSVIATDGDVVRTRVEYAAAQTAAPASPADWLYWTIDEAESPAIEDDPLPLPGGVGAFVTSARLSNGAPIVAYYDRALGALKLARFDVEQGQFLEPEVLAGGGDRNAGWFPSLAVDEEDNIFVTYVDVTYQDLYLLDVQTGEEELIDDGYRVVGQTEEGLDIPEFHFVGADNTLVFTIDGPVVTYQDATSHELIRAWRYGEDPWANEVLAGNSDPFAGGYGFYARSAWTGRRLVTSSMVIDLPSDDTWVEVIRDNIVVE